MSFPQSRPPGFAMLPARVLDSPAWAKLSKTQINVYVTLARHASGEINSESRSCYPGIERIAYYARTTPRTVEKAIKRLCELGLIEKQVGSGRSRTNKYRLLIPALYDGVVQSDRGISDLIKTPSERAGYPVSQDKKSVRLSAYTPSGRTGECTREQTHDPTMSEDGIVALLDCDSQVLNNNSAKHALHRLGVYPSEIDKLAKENDANRVIRVWLNIDRQNVKSPVGMLVQRLRHADCHLPQPTPKAIAAAWNNNLIQVITYKSVHLENKGIRMKYNTGFFGLKGSVLRIKRDEIPYVIFE